MRKLIIIWLAAFSLLFVGCGESVEEIWINADGKGAIHKKIDMSEMLALIQMGMMMEEESDSVSGETDEFEKLFTQEKFDTLVHVESLLQEAAEETGETYSRLWAREKFLNDLGDQVNNPDSVWEIIEPLLDAQMQMRMDMDNELFDLTFMLPIQDFNQIKKLDLGPLMKDMGDQVGDDVPFDMGMLSPDIDYEFEVEKKRVLITIPHIDTSGTSSEDDMMDMFMGMMGEGNGKKLIVHVPGKVKQVNQSTATYNDNKVIYEIDYDRLIDHNDNINLVIDFKPKRKFRNIAPH